MGTAFMEAFGYDVSANFIPADQLDDRPFKGYSHVYRTARERCGLQGVYLLGAFPPSREDGEPRQRSEVPVVFYCKAENEAEADDIHRRVWNQGVAPFVLVETVGTLRLYSGFRFSAKADSDRERGVLEAAVAFNEVADRLAAFKAEAIDTGVLWDRWGQEADPGSRVDWSLLGELEKLAKELRKRGLEREHAHALIGKFVYLKYLRDRKILSDEKLARWNLDAAQVFGRRATLTAFQAVNAELAGWLNGSVFPLPEKAIRAGHLQLVADVFAGGTASGQLALDLGIYDFSFVPIEMLSVIYEQFLHAPEPGKANRGKKASAYYTPIPVVKYMLAELESRRPLVEGMRVLDPSCGSGAFLVQCYRILIEKRLTAEDPLRPTELRALLTKHVFGVDRDPEACQVTEMSLILTLLDYTEQPDLESKPQFKLPKLRDSNIFCADFFAPESRWTQKRSNLKVDWLVGNPPWREAKEGERDDEHVLKWIREKANEWPTGGNQIAEAFVGHALQVLNEGAAAALLLPAMTLFKMESTKFRAQLFKSVRAWQVTNFANLAYVLFGGRSQVPALALFFQGRPEGMPPAMDESLLTFAPFLVNQISGRAKHPRQRRETWNIVVNSTEVREIRASVAIDGGFGPWKEAMWGTYRDTRLLDRIARRFPTLEKVTRDRELKAHEGFQLRENSPGTVPMPELAGKKQVVFLKLRKCGRIFTFPQRALSKIPPKKANVRKGRGELPKAVSTPPHVIVDASRRFAIYSDEFIAVPARKPGISGRTGTENFLKALSLYLSSNFCRYQQFFTTSEWGVHTSLVTLDSLKAIPTPVGELQDEDLHDWAALQQRLASEYSGGATPPREKLGEVDEKVYQLLGLTSTERILVEDFIRWNMQVIKGKVPPEVVAPPSHDAMDAYLCVLRDQLDGFIGSDAGLRHELTAVRGKESAMLSIRLVSGDARPAAVLEAGDETAAALERTREHLLQRHSQWLYFERSLKIYEDGAMYVFKPMEMLHWTRRQAILDAGEIIAETLGSGDP